VKYYGTPLIWIHHHRRYLVIKPGFFTKQSQSIKHSQNKMMKTIFTKQQEKMLKLFTATALIFGISGFSLTAHAQTFVKVFTSQEEREYLDYLREDFVSRSQLTTFNIDEDVIPDIPDAIVTEEVATEVTSYKFGGIMTRINGNRMVWLNGEQVAEAALPENLSIVSSQSGVQLRILQSDQVYLIKPGEQLDLNNGSSTTNSTTDSAAEPETQSLLDPAPNNLPSTITAQQNTVLSDTGSEALSAPPEPPVDLLQLEE